jgi:hypothetical protein
LDSAGEGRKRKGKKKGKKERKKVIHRDYFLFSTSPPSFILTHSIL